MALMRDCYSVQTKLEKHNEYSLNLYEKELE